MSPRMCVGVVVASGIINVLRRNCFFFVVPGGVDEIISGLHLILWFIHVSLDFKRISARGLVRPRYNEFNGDRRRHARNAPSSVCGRNGTGYWIKLRCFSTARPGRSVVPRSMGATGTADWMKRQIWGTHAPQPTADWLLWDLVSGYILGGITYKMVAVWSEWGYGWNSRYISRRKVKLLQRCWSVSAVTNMD